MQFVIDKCGSREKLLLQLSDIRRYPNSRRQTYWLLLRVDGISKKRAETQQAWVLINGVDFVAENQAVVRGVFTRKFKGNIGTNWWLEKPFKAVIDFSSGRKTKGKLEVLFTHRFVEVKAEFIGDTPNKRTLSERVLEQGWLADVPDFAKSLDFLDRISQDRVFSHRIDELTHEGWQPLQTPSS